MVCQTCLTYYIETSQRDWYNFLQHRAAKAQQARKIYTSSALGYKVSVLFRIDYNIASLFLFISLIFVRYDMHYCQIVFYQILFASSLYISDRHAIEFGWQLGK